MTNTAAFLFVQTNIAGCWAATTRPGSDTDDVPAIGLPGGKVEHHEWKTEAALREAYEEGWWVLGDPQNRDLVLVHEDRVEDTYVQWYWAPDFMAKPLDHYKEVGRVRPIHATLGRIAASGFGNEAAVEALLQRIAQLEWATAAVWRADNMAAEALECLCDGVPEVALLRRFDPKWREWDDPVQFPDGSTLVWEEGDDFWRAYK